VNSIQDKWPDELLGLMAAGMRIGHFNRMTCFLENHIMGDPTLRFTPNVDLKCNINEVLTLKRGDVAFWKKQLNSPVADMQSLALRQLADADYKDMVSLLEQTYYNSDFFVVRLQALRLLTLNYPKQAVAVIKDALNDSYELVRRYAGEYAEKNGSPELLAAWVEAYLQRPYEKRLRFKIWGGLDAFNYKQIIKEVETQAASQTWYDRAIVDKFLKQIPLQEKSMNSTITLINDAKAKMKDVRSELRAIRNHPVGVVIEPMLTLIKDETRDKELRMTAAEAFGWYNLYHDKASLVEKLKAIETNDGELKNELQKTINRLESKNR
jgi:HEAT repeat protein